VPTTIVVTGTGTPIPTPDRAGPGVLVRTAETAVQFDAGRNTLARLEACGVHVSQLDALFLTHHHSDHLTGLPDLVLTRWVLDSADSGAPLRVVAPEGPTARFVERMLEPWSDDIAVRRAHTGRATQPRVELVRFAAGDSVREIWRQGEVAVSSIAVRHDPVRPAVGFRVDTPDGSVAISGDTLVCDEVAALAAGADLLIYEALRFDVYRRRFGEDRRRTFILDYHADTHAIGRQAAALGVPRLLLTHLIPPPESPEDEAGFEADVRRGGYRGELIVARDLASVTLG